MANAKGFIVPTGCTHANMLFELKSYTRNHERLIAEYISPTSNDTLTVVYQRRGWDSGIQDYHYEPSARYYNGERYDLLEAAKTEKAAKKAAKKVAAKKDKPAATKAAVPKAAVPKAKKVERGTPLKAVKKPAKKGGAK